MCNVWYKDSGDKELQTIFCIADYKDVLTMVAADSLCGMFFVNVVKLNVTLYH